MDKFEYLATLFSVVAGLALTRGLSGLAKTVHNRHKVKPSGVHMAWTGSILLWLVSYWWFTFFLAPIEQWTVPLFLFILVYGAFIYFLLALLFPGKAGGVKDQLEYFIGNRRWFFGTFVMLGVIDVLDTYIKSRVGAGIPPLLPYSVFMAAWIILGTVAAITSSRQFHTVYAYVWFFFFAAWALQVL